MKVLVVDDSQVICDRITSLVSETEGLEVVAEAHDGEEACEYAGSLSPDIVILDIRMPRKSGIEVLASMKEREPSPLVVVLTNYPYPQYRKRCEEYGADYFLDKGGEFEKLAEILETARDRHEAGDAARLSMPGKRNTDVEFTTEGGKRENG